MMTDKEKIRDLQITLNNLMVLNEAAFIEWRKGEGAEAAMDKWIGGQLFYSGNVPDSKGKDAATYYRENRTSYPPLAENNKEADSAT